MAYEPIKGEPRRGVPDESSEAFFARRRREDRTYVSKPFRLRLPFSQDHGELARFVTKVFDEADEPVLPEENLEWTHEAILTTPGGRKQVQLQVAREEGKVREIKIQSVPVDGPKLGPILRLNRHQSEKFIQMVRGLEYIPLEEDAETVRVDDDVIREVFKDPNAVGKLYAEDPERIRHLIESDASAEDVLALARRRKVVEEFRSLLEDDEKFDALAKPRGPEHVWQEFLEGNPWILGVALSGQLLTRYDETKLERVVVGASVAGPGKRADALLRTNGAIRSLVLAEIKHHRTHLLGKVYRSGAWGMSAELAGGISQAQQTVHLARQYIGDHLPEKDEEGGETGDVAKLVRPRSYLIAGDLRECMTEKGNLHPEKHRSFELGRRNLYEPEIITFDELLARAEWHVSASASG